MARCDVSLPAWLASGPESIGIPPSDRRAKTVRMYNPPSSRGARSRLVTPSERSFRQANGRVEFSGLTNRSERTVLSVPSRRGVFSPIRIAFFSARPGARSQSQPHVCPDSFPSAPNCRCASGPGHLIPSAVNRYAGLSHRGSRRIVHMRHSGSCKDDPQVVPTSTGEAKMHSEVLHLV